MEQNAVTYPLLEPENQQEEPPDQYDLSEDGSDEEEPTNNELGNVLDEGSFFSCRSIFQIWKIDKDKLEVTFTNNFLSFSS